MGLKFFVELCEESAQDINDFLININEGDCVRMVVFCEDIIKKGVGTYQPVERTVTGIN